MRLQAKDKMGNWKDIEYRPQTAICLYGYSPPKLPPMHYWSFTLPSFEGVFTTELRVAVEIHTRMSAFEEYKVETIYSVVFEGSINPGQLWREPSYDESYKIFHPFDKK